MNQSTVSDAAALSARAQASHRRALVVVGAMTAGLLVYAFLVEWLRRSGTLPGGGVSEVVRWAFYAVAVTMVFTSHVVKSIMLRGPDAGSPDAALARLTTAHVVTAAMAEAPAILGFVLFVLDRRFYTDFYILSLVSLYLLVRHFPRFGSWESIVRRHRAAS